MNHISKYENDSLLQLLLSGKEEDFKIVFDNFCEGLCLYAESIVRDYQAAEEIVEDILFTFGKTVINYQFKFL